MAVQHRRRHTPVANDSLELLQKLIETPPAPPDRRMQPVALRSATEQRRHALGGYLLRTWVDTLLAHAERLLVIAAVLVFGLWFADGPLRDWLHEQQATAAIAPPIVTPVALAPARLVTPAASSLDDDIPLPYTTPDMAAPPLTDDFIAPRQGVVAAPVTIAPQPTRLLIPSIAVDTPIKEVFIVDGAWEVADYAAGYMHGTGLPGESGNMAMAGHAGLRGGVFRDLGSLVDGADIYVDAAGWRYHYRVRESKSVWPTQVEVLDPTETATLTLLTCTNWDTQRLVVVADLIDSKPSPGS
jgi:sortase A